MELPPTSPLKAAPSCDEGTSRTTSTLLVWASLVERRAADFRRMEITDGDGGRTFTIIC